MGRISYDATEKKLRREFEEYGPIKSVRLVNEKRSGLRSHALYKCIREPLCSCLWSKRIALVRILCFCVARELCLIAIEQNQQARALQGSSSKFRPLWLGRLTHMVLPFTYWKQGQESSWQAQVVGRRMGSRAKGLLVQGSRGDMPL